jgi:cell division protein ftsQ
VLPDRGVELVPRVGQHVVFIGYLPQAANTKERNEKIADYVNKKLTRLEKFYKYGLSQVGWNKYSYIDLEFDNQIICKKKKENKNNPE